MCGIVGALRLSPASPAIDLDALRRAREAMAVRGPDGSGEWVSPSGRIGLGHRRLAIIDLSPSAAQPMASSDGRFVLVFNGEVYNYRELRGRLAAEGERFRTASDAEVILVLLAQAVRSGAAPEAVLARVRGMYALGFWDEAAARLLLARDPLGIKPLYSALAGGVLHFASQVRALEPVVPDEVDPVGVAGFLLWGSLPEPYTLRKAVRAVPAGHVVEAVGGRMVEARAIPWPEADAGVGDALAAAGNALEDSVRAHLVSDVPVGLLLSAGLDSGLIAALASRLGGARMRAVTAAFEAHAGTRADESPGALETAQALGLELVVRRFAAQELEALLPRALEAMDQPSIDGVNTWLACLAAREAGLKVVLSGLGGDELFGSYPSFRQVPRLAAWAARGQRLPFLERPLGTLGRAAGRPKLAGLLAHGSALAGAYFLRRGLFLPEELPGILGPEAAARGLAAYDPLRDASRFEVEDAWLAVQHMESGLYLRNQLLRDADWASMAHSVELRTPLVDAWLSSALGANGFEPARTRGKAFLVSKLAPELPASVLGRRKRGFSIPSGQPRLRAGSNARALALEVLERRGLAVRRATIPA